MIHREMANERERGKELAKILSSDNNFVKEINEKKSSKEKTKYLISFLRDRKLFTEQNPLTILSLSMCAYTLETEYKIDMKCGDWKLNTDEEFLKETDEEGLARMLPVYNSKGKKRDNYERKDDKK
jgi:predicted patatin/cPLA2 family phospholipase